jgi:hypothetical protein
MSEQNILNPTPTSLFSPDYGFIEGVPELRTVLQAQSGKMFTRRQRGAGRVYQLDWKNRGAAVTNALRQWEEQYRNDFFSIADWIRGRYFSGRFQAPLSFSPAGNEQWSIKGIFEELPTVNLYQYPMNWGVDSIFLGPRNGFGDDLVKLTPVQPPGTNWTYTVDANAHSGAYYSDANTNTTDKAEWVYFGYGCRIWAQKNTNLGIFTASVTRVRDGTVMATGLVDLYEPALAISAPVFGENLLTYSRNFDNTIWTMNQITRPSGGTIVAPDGTTTAEALIPASATDAYTIQGFAGRIGATYTGSVWLKVPSGTKTINIYIADGGGNFTLQSVNITTTWTRFTVTRTIAAGATGPSLQIGGGGSWTAGEIDAWESQVDEGSVAQPNIHTGANALNLSIPLDTYRVAITATNTKNAASSANTILADALEVMR